MDPTSPFGQLPQKPPAMCKSSISRCLDRHLQDQPSLERKPQGDMEDANPSCQREASFNTQSSYGAYGTQTPNPFAATASNPSMSPSKPQQHQQQSIPALNSRLFEPPQLPKQFAAPQFRNPAFTTPQRRGGEELVSECSGAEESPAATDMSECLADADTPEVDRSEDFAKMTITPHKINRGGLSAKLFSRSHAPGRGEVPRGRSDLHHRDKVRKRKRLQGDKDVGSVRARLPHDSDDSDSDWPDDVSRGRNSRGKKEGWFRSALTAIHDHPNVPAILAGYIHLAVWLVLVSFGVFCLWGFIATFRSDIALASDQARAALLEESRYCASQYTSNQCSPRQNRPPALEEKCNEWEACMHQDADRVHQVQVSAKNIAEIINEFAGVLSIKAYVGIFALTLFGPRRVFC